MRGRIQKLLLVFSILVAGLLVAFLLLALARPRPTVLPLPNPNGYSDFVKAGEMLEGDFGNYGSWPLETVRSMIATNRQSLARLRIGLSNQCRVPLDFSPDLTAHLQEVPTVKRMALALATEGRLAELEGRPGDAARIYLEGIRLGQEAVRGGTFIDALVGLAMESIPVAKLEKLSGQLDAATCREVARALEQIEDRRQSLEEVIQQELMWCRRTYGLKGELLKVVNFKSARNAQRGVATKLKAQQLRNRALILSLATRAYQLENGQPPKSPAELVPRYLTEVPQTVSNADLSSRQ